MALLSTDKNWNHYVAAAETVARGAGFQALRDRILELGELRADHEVLDLGSGTGLLTLPAAERARRVWAVDVSHGMGDYLEAKARSAGLDNVETICASAVSVPLVDASMQVVISNYCFHHLDNADKLIALAEVHRTLVPGGRLVIGDMMFSLAPGDRRNRAVVRRKVRSLLAKGPGGAWRLARNGARYVAGRWERPANATWWSEALRQCGFVEVSVETFEHEGGIATARKPGLNGSS